jgi:hypothetical protein
MADALPDLDALTTAIEMGETIDMILNARAEAKRLIHEALRGGKHTVKAAADAWLAWRYGWNTLAMDIQAAHELLLNPITFLVISGRSGTTVKSSHSEVIDSHWANLAYRSNHEFSYDASYRAKFVARLKVSTLNVVVDPAISLWESFPVVADWFVNVGDVLAAWNVRRRCESVSFSISRKVTANHTGTVTDAWPKISTFTDLAFSGTSTEKAVLLERLPMSPPILVPSIDVNLTGKRIADAAALLAKRIL